jgi:Group II intron, maturase-specific domain
MDCQAVSSIARSSRAGPHARRCSTPATVSGQLTARQRLLLPVEDVVQDLNRYLRGWAGYFRYGNSARHFNLIEHHAHNRLALFVAQAPPTIARLRLVDGQLPLTRSHGPDQPLGNRRRAQAPPGLEGIAECRR